MRRRANNAGAVYFYYEGIYYKQDKRFFRQLFFSFWAARISRRS